MLPMVLVNCVYRSGEYNALQQTLELTLSEKAEAACLVLKQTLASVHLATVDADGIPHTGCVPFIWHEGDLLIYVSRLSIHTRDLLANPQVSAMLVEDEQGCVQPFARKRLRYHCDVHIIDNNDALYEPLLDDFAQKHGKTVDLLRQLPDFVLFRLAPAEGIFVMGFGQAYKLTGPRMDTFVQVRSA